MKSKIKYIQSLSQKKLREEEGVFVAEGPKIVEEILQSAKVELRELFATGKWIQQNPDTTRHLGHQLVEVAEDDLKRISFLQTPNQVCGIFSRPVFTPFEPYDKISLMLDTIQDPGNLGTIVRCADWFGVQHIICSKECVDIYNPKVVQSTMGSICRVHVIYEELSTYLKDHAEIPAYAATLEGNDITHHQTIREGIILIGNESKGLQPGLLSLATHRITIPRKGKAESLNAAVATGIILSHVVE